LVKAEARDVKIVGNASPAPATALVLMRPRRVSAFIMKLLPIGVSGARPPRHGPLPVYRMSGNYCAFGKSCNKGFGKKDFSVKNMTMLVQNL
jgi:hypothetical protein